MRSILPQDAWFCKLHWSGEWGVTQKGSIHITSGGASSNFRIVDNGTIDGPEVNSMVKLQRYGRDAALVRGVLGAP